MKKTILNIDKRRDISATIYFTSPNFNDTDFIDFLFSRRVRFLFEHLIIFYLPFQLNI